MSATGLLGRWAAWRWRFPIEIALAFLLGLMLTMYVARSLRDQPAAARTFIWDDYLAAVAGLYALNHDLDGARRSLALLPSENPIAALNAAEAPGTGAVQERNRRNLDELRGAVNAAGPLPAGARVTPVPLPAPAEPTGPDALNLLAAFGVLVALGALTVGGSRLLSRAQGGPAAPRRERPARRRPIDTAAEAGADELPDGEPARSRSRRSLPTPAPGPERRPEPARPAFPLPRRVPAPEPPPEPIYPAGSHFRLRCEYHYGEDNFEELLPITERGSGHLLGGCGVSSGLALPDAGDTEAYVAFSIWVHDNRGGPNVRSVGVVSRWAWAERRDEVEDWANKMGLEGIEVARPGRLRDLEADRIRVTVSLDEVEYGHASNLPRNSYFSLLGISFEVTITDAPA